VHWRILCEKKLEREHYKAVKSMIEIFNHFDKVHEYDSRAELP